MPRDLVKKYRSVTITSMLINTAHQCYDFHPVSVSYKTTIYVIRDIVARSSNVYTSSAMLRTLFRFSGKQNLYGGIISMGTLSHTITVAHGLKENIVGGKRVKVADN
jgi:hypothetical protein